MERKIIVEDQPTPSGYPANLVLRSQQDGRLYKVDPSGSFRRITPKSPSKKERRKARKS